MAEITAQMVSDFRKTTGLGLMECKAILKEAKRRGYDLIVLGVSRRPGDTLFFGNTALAVLEDVPTRAAVDAERAVLATLEGGCSAPIGALAEVVEGEDEEELWVRAVALSPDGTLSVRMSATGSPADAVGVGTRLGAEMLADGAGQLGQPGPAATTEADKVREA